MASVRVDKWLWAARMFKTRSAATKACAAGEVKVDEAVAKASTSVKVDALVEARTPRGRMLLKVTGLADKRGPASVAEGLYEDLTPEEWKEKKPVWEDDGRSGQATVERHGRPSKRDRRQVRKIRGW